jgi:hypothetical protein
MNRRTLLLLLPLALIALVVPTGEGLQAQGSFGFGAQRAPAIDVDRSGNIYLTMSVATKPASERTPGSQIFFTMSRDGGQTWDNLPQTRNLSNSDGEAFGPSIAVAKSGKTRIYVVYHDNVTRTTQVYLLRTKKKTKFRSPRNITPHDGGAFTPRVAVDPEGGVNVVWGDLLGGNRHVVFVRSTDQGATFGEPQDISASVGSAFDPEMVVAATPTGFNIYVVWEDTAPGESAIMFARSTDGGNTFSTPNRISAETGFAAEAHIATDALGRIHVAWVGAVGGDLQAVYSRSTDGGISFSEPMNLSSARGADIHKPYVATSQDRVFVAYNDEASRSRQVSLVTSDDEGVSFGSPVQVSDANPALGRAHSAAMVADPSGTLHVVWIDTSLIGNDEGLLHYANTTNGRRFESQKMILAVVQR